MNILRESMTKMTIIGVSPTLIIRIWRQETDDNLCMITARYELKTAVYKALESVQLLERLNVAKAILALPNVNAVEVLDLDGNGEVLYRYDEVMIGDKKIAII